MIKGTRVSVPEFEIVSSPKVKWSEINTRKFNVFGRKRSYVSIIKKIFININGNEIIKPTHVAHSFGTNKVLVRTYKIKDGRWKYDWTKIISRYRINKYYKLTGETVDE